MHHWISTLMSTKITLSKSRKESREYVIIPEYDEKGGEIDKPNPA